MDDLRMALLGWVQDHYIQRYQDKSVVSHNEGVEELLALIEPFLGGLIHIPLAPFDRPTRWKCCVEKTCDGQGHKFVQRSTGSKDDRISQDKWYFAKIHGRWYSGRFSQQWYGWSFNDWSTSGIQLNSIEDLYEITNAPHE